MSVDAFDLLSNTALVFMSGTKEGRWNRGTVEPWNRAFGLTALEVILLILHGDLWRGFSN